MRYLIMIGTCFVIALAAHSQKTIFIRVFDAIGKKTHKGFLSSVSDSSLTINNGGQITEVTVSKIYTIIVKRSLGHTVAISTAVGAAGFSIWGAATADPDEFLGYTAGEGAVGGFILGAFAGAAAGSIIAAVNRKPVLKINADQKEWLKAKSTLSYYMEKMNK